MSGQPVGPIFKGQQSKKKKKKKKKKKLDCLTIQDGTHRFSQNVSMELPLYTA